MNSTLTLVFEFSASYSQGDRVTGHNYILSATFDALEEPAEPAIRAAVEKELIQKIHSRDLGQHVDFLKGKALTDLSLLRTFWPRVSQACSPARLVRLCLERDRRTRWTLTAAPK
jgi:hypothetical protein